MGKKPPKNGPGKTPVWVGGENEGDAFPGGKKSPNKRRDQKVKKPKTRGTNGTRSRLRDFEEGGVN